MTMRIVALLLLAVPVPKESVLFFGFDNDSFYVVGKWVPTDEKQKAGFLNETEIDCFRKTMTCVQGSAEYYMSYPHVSLGYFDVIKWDKDGIVSTDSTKECMTLTMQVSFAEKSVLLLHSMKQLDSEKKEACKFIGAEKTEQEVLVVKGSERWKKEHTRFFQNESTMPTALSQ